MGDLIVPYEIGRVNVCPKCVKPSLFLVEKNIDMTYVDINGGLQDHRNIHHESNLICFECRNKYDYKKAGNVVMIYTDREKEIDKARDTLKSVGYLEDFFFKREDTDSESREEDYI